MPKLFLLFSHEITDKQKNDAIKSLNIDKIILLPDNLQSKWSNIPANLDSLKEYLLPFKRWLNKEVEKDDYILVQGEFGAVYFIVSWAKNNNLTPIYSTTERNVKEKIDGEIVKSVKKFEHIRFRKYDNWT
ncbi:MAG: CRISPR-associated protein Csx20 [Candidatus Woesearchaeota archaeon]